MKKIITAFILTVVMSVSAMAITPALILDKGDFKYVNYQSADFVDNEPASGNKTSIKGVDCYFQNYEWGYLKVSWKSKSKASGYQVEYSSSKKFNGAYRCSVGKLQNHVTAKGGMATFKKGNTYYVRVRATYKNDKAGKWSKTFRISR